MALLKIMTFNTFILHLPPFRVGAITQKRRIDAMLKDNIFNDSDIVILQELYNPTMAKRLLDGMRSLGFKYQTPISASRSSKINTAYHSEWNRKKGSAAWFQFICGGVAIVSRHPIIHQEYMIFDNKGCGLDRLAAKGAVYAKLNVNGSHIHVIGTHLQSDTYYFFSPSPTESRKRQLREIKVWMNEHKMDIQDIFIFSGDLNINIFSDAYYDTLSLFDLAEPEWSAFVPTWDPQSNSLAQTEAKNSSQQWHLDYIFVRNIKSYHEYTKKIKMQSSYYHSNIKHHEYSDHYPVFAEIDISPKIPNQ